jgi:HEAT repeat protein
MLAGLDDANYWVRYHAVDALGYLGGYGAPATKHLADIAAGPDRFARLNAIAALGHIGPEARDAIPTLKKAATDEDPEVSSSAVKAMKQIDLAPLARQACRNATGQMRQWLKALEEDDTPAAVAAADALGKLGFAGQAAAPGLALMLRHSDRQRRLAAATALGGLGLAAAEYVPTLEVAARDADADVRAAAAKALEPPSKAVEHHE